MKCVVGGTYGAIGYLLETRHMRPIGLALADPVGFLCPLYASSTPQ
jgi:hypothetical protein